MAFDETRGLVLSELGPSLGIGWGGPSGEDSTSQSGSPPMLSSPQIVLFLSYISYIYIYIYTYKYNALYIQQSTKAGGKLGHPGNA